MELDVLHSFQVLSGVLVVLVDCRAVAELGTVVELSKVIESNGTRQR
jgi:hypothetical protein